MRQIDEAERIIGKLQSAIKEYLDHGDMRLLDWALNHPAPSMYASGWHEYYKKYYSDRVIHDPCPNCGTNLDNGPIPVEIAARYYSAPYRWQREIGIVEHDRVVRWKCPDCEHEWPAR